VKSRIKDYGVRSKGKDMKTQSAFESQESAAKTSEMVE